MITQEHLYDTELELGFSYPPSFVYGAQEFSTLTASEYFRRAFSNTRLLFSQSEIATAREIIPTTFLPFMRQEQPSGTDIYAFDLDSMQPEFRVVVWADHSVVMDWENFPVFIQWVREIIAKYDTTA